MLHLIPQEEPEYGLLKCSTEDESTPHDVWTFHRMGHSCNVPDHKAGLYMVMRRCQHCGTYTEWCQLTGPDGGIFQIVLSANEVATFMAGLGHNGPDLPF